MRGNSQVAVASIFYQKLRLNAAKRAQKSQLYETQKVDPEEELAELVQRPQPQLAKADETKATKKKPPTPPTTKIKEKLGEVHQELDPTPSPYKKPSPRPRRKATSNVHAIPILM